jgi:biopolymer transport protein ExbD
MARRRRRRHNQSEVELNLAAMLDMAFQLLAFFCLTFKPAPVEGQIQLRLPPPQAILSTKNATEKTGSDVNNKNPVQGVNTLTITVFADPKTGGIQSLGVGEVQVANVEALDAKLREVFADPGNPFDQVIIQVSDACRYDELMKVVDICTHQVLPGGHKLSKLSFVEIPSG